MSDLQILNGDSFAIPPTLAADDEKFEAKVCSMCGATANDFWETEPLKPVALKLLPRFGDAENLLVICDECSEGLQNVSLPKPDQIYLLTQIRRATITDQQAVLNWLLQKFGLEATKRNETE